MAVKHEETSADLVASLERKRKRQLVSMQGRTTHEVWFNGFLGKRWVMKTGKEASRAWSKCSRNSGLD